MLLLYHVCHQLGRLPFELPDDLPDEQLVLMSAYMQLRAELRANKTAGIDLAGKAAEKRLQAAESAAWRTRSGV